MKRFLVPALVLLAACSQTPVAPTVPRLEPQFGSAAKDFGVDAASASAGRVYVLSEQEGVRYDRAAGDNSVYEDAYLRRYDGNGSLAWSRQIASVSCYEQDDYCVRSLRAQTLVADAGGSSYALVLDASWGVQDCAAVTTYRVYKYGAAGNLVRTVNLGENGYSFGGDSGPAFTPASDLAADGGGNLYVVRQQAVFSDDYCDAARTDVVAKYAATGGLQWQRLSPVGTLYGVSVSGSGYVYVAGSTGVAKYTGSGTLVWTKAGAAQDVAAVGSNTVYTRNLTAIRKLEGNGKQLWSRTQSGLTGLAIGDMTADGGADVYLTGKYNASGSNRDVFTRKLSARGGATLFTKTFGTAAYDDAEGIATLDGTEIYLTGETQASLGPAYQGGESDAFLRKLNASGTSVWTR